MGKNHKKHTRTEEEAENESKGGNANARRRRLPLIHQAQRSFFRFGKLSYDVMERVFSFMNETELCRSAAVCLEWKFLLSGPFHDVDDDGDTTTPSLSLSSASGGSGVPRPYLRMHSKRLKLVHQMEDKSPRGVAQTTETKEAAEAEAEAVAAEGEAPLDTTMSAAAATTPATKTVVVKSKARMNLEANDQIAHIYQGLWQSLCSRRIANFFRSFVQMHKHPTSRQFDLTIAQPHTDDDSDWRQMLDFKQCFMSMTCWPGQINAEVIQTLGLSEQIRVSSIAIDEEGSEHKQLQKNSSKPSPPAAAAAAANPLEGIVRELMLHVAAQSHFGEDRCIHSDHPFPFVFSRRPSPPFVVISPHRTSISSQQTQPPQLQSSSSHDEKIGLKLRHSLVAYFEVRIGKDQESTRRRAGRTVEGAEVQPPCVAIGLGRPGFRILRNQPGWDRQSFGYHGDDGGLFHDAGAPHASFPTFGDGDTVGCGINYKTNCIFFTKNGDYLGVGFDQRTVRGYLFPVVGIDSASLIQLNFGLSPFVFDIEAYEAQYAPLDGLHSLLRTSPVLISNCLFFTAGLRQLGDLMAEHEDDDDDYDDDDAVEIDSEDGSDAEDEDEDEARVRVNNLLRQINDISSGSDDVYDSEWDDLEFGEFEMDLYAEDEDEDEDEEDEDDVDAELDFDAADNDDNDADADEERNVDEVDEDVEAEQDDEAELKEE